MGANGVAAHQGGTEVRGRRETRPETPNPLHATLILVPKYLVADRPWPNVARSTQPLPLSLERAGHEQYRRSGTMLHLSCMSAFSQRDRAVGHRLSRALLFTGSRFSFQESIESRGYSQTLSNASGIGQNPSSCTPFQCSCSTSIIMLRSTSG